MNNELKIKSFTDLHAWQEAHQFALEVYRVTVKFPSEERYSLIDQIRRAAVSVTSNIAEGFSRNTYNEKINFYGIAQGSVTEAQNQLILARDLHYLPALDFEKLFEQSVIAHKLINGLIKGARKLRDS